MHENGWRGRETVFKHSFAVTRAISHVPKTTVIWTIFFLPCVLSVRSVPYQKEGKKKKTFTIPCGRFCSFHTSINSIWWFCCTSAFWNVDKTSWWVKWNRKKAPREREGQSKKKANRIRSLSHRLQIFHFRNSGFPFWLTHKMCVHIHAYNIHIRGGI